MSKTPNFSVFHIRKWYLQIEDTLAGETGQPADGLPLRKIVIAACIHNPFAGRFVEDLSSWIEPSPELGREFGRRIRDIAGEQPIQSYGKACLVGIDGEYEHGNALLTNPAANPVRDGVGGGAAGARPDPVAWSVRVPSIRRRMARQSQLCSASGVARSRHAPVR